MDDGNAQHRVRRRVALAELVEGNLLVRSGSVEDSLAQAFREGGRIGDDNPSLQGDWPAVVVDGRLVVEGGGPLESMYRFVTQRNVVTDLEAGISTTVMQGTDTVLMIGMRVVLVACDENGNIDIEDLRAKAEAHRDTLAALMITYPSTHGVFEEGIREICDRNDWLMISDEVLTGLGRTGRMWGIGHYDVVPDILSWALFN